MEKYWLDALFVKNNHIIEGWCGKDGLLIYGLKKDLLSLLHEYPVKKGEWYFNSSFDRLIAEKNDSVSITANPQLLWQNGYEIIT